ncbi:MAG: CRISPR-associated protein Csx20 [Calditrichia bacterium]
MDKTCLIIINHRILNSQEMELRQLFNVKQLQFLPESLSELWKNIPADEDNELIGLTQLKDYMLKVTKENDLVWIQGDFGATFYLVNVCFNFNRIPIYAFSLRKSTEKQLLGNSISKQSVFEHITFKKYRRPDE